MAECDRQRFSGLELLPTSMLEKIIEQDFNQEADYEQELIDYVLELIAKRAKTENPSLIPNMQSSWNKLQQRLESEVNLGSLPPTPFPAEKTKAAPRRMSFLRYVAVVVACITLLLGAMVTVQAMGVDVFGTLASWTDKVFRFNLPISSYSDETQFPDFLPPEYYNSLSQGHIPTELLPSSIPSDYNLNNVASIKLSDISGIYLSFINQKGEFFNITVMKHTRPESINGFSYIKDSKTPVSYTSNGIPFYIFANDNLCKAVGTVSEYTIQVDGISSEQELKTILNSIKGEH